jgi:hypothetical protein
LGYGLSIKKLYFPIIKAKVSNVMKTIALTYCVFFILATGRSQHEHHNMANDSSMHDQMMEKDTMDHGGMLMSNSYSLNLAMNRNGSGTSWLPDSSPMYMYMMGNSRNSWVIHGDIFVRYNNQDLFNAGSRGGIKWDAVTMLTGMYNRRVGERGLFNATAMLSADPYIMGGTGYPLLFQTGETYNGKKLVDRQHPHDLFSGLSVAYTYAINKDIDLTGYFGYPGEPALGPVSFMHRPSAMNNPNAPLGHHWQDATHTTFGVGTLGLRINDVKLEASIFTGREPDENRYDFDKPTFDSYSYRLSWNPTSTWAFQFSQGFLHSPDPLEPDVDVNRITASVINSKYMRTLNWSQSLIWGLNHYSGQSKDEHSILYENNLQFRMQAIYMRYEFVTKSADELDIQDHFGQASFNINSLTIGYNHQLAPLAPLEISLGLQGTMNFAPMQLQELYGVTPVGLQVYLLLRPHKMTM